MSRVEPKEKRAAREAEKGRRQPVDRTPIRAEGDQRIAAASLKGHETGRVGRRE